MFKEKEGDDTGMQTRVWGPSGWLFLHCIAQNYPWKPTPEQKMYYLNFFRLTGNVLPCRYCRESYQKFINEPGNTNLNETVVENRKNLVTWLYLVHNKVNKKLGISEAPSLKDVWNKYESFRSKCTKSPEVKEIIKTGCLDPLRGFRKKCVIDIIDVDKDGKQISSSFGSSKTIKLISIKRSNNSSKKFMATFKSENGRTKVIHFGAKGMSDFTQHKDTLRKKRYFARHRKDLSTKDPSRAGYLSMFVLWNKKNLNASIKDYKRRLNIYNKTGKFPIN